MPERNSTICKLYQKLLAYNEASNHHCEVWCKDEEDNAALQDKNLKE